MPRGCLSYSFYLYIGHRIYFNFTDGGYQMLSLNRRLPFCLLR